MLKIKYAIRNKTSHFYLCEIALGICQYEYQERTDDPVFAYHFNSIDDAQKVLDGKDDPLHHTYDPKFFEIVELRITAEVIRVGLQRDER